MGIPIHFRFVVESADRKNICQLPTENVPMGTQEKKSALQIGFLNKRGMKIYGIPKSVVIWISPSKRLRYFFLKLHRPKTFKSVLKKKKKISLINRLSKAFRENEIYGIPKSLAIDMGISFQYSFEV